MALSESLRGRCSNTIMITPYQKIQKKLQVAHENLKGLEESIGRREGEVKDMKRERLATKAFIEGLKFAAEAFENQ